MCLFLGWEISLDVCGEGFDFEDCWDRSYVKIYVFVLWFFLFLNFYFKIRKYKNNFEF